MNKIIKQNFWFLLFWSFILIGTCINSFKANSSDFIVTPVFETAPVPTSGDSADDPAIWLHPTAPEKSVIIGTNKKGGLFLYNLNGEEIFKIATSTLFNNVDVAYNISFGGKLIDVAVATEKTKKSFVIYQITNNGNQLKQISPFIKNQNVSYGICLYQSQLTGKLFSFVTGQKGKIEQWEIFDGLQGEMSARKVREMHLSSITEGCVVDHEYGIMYTAEENIGIWKFNAEPDESPKGELLYSINENSDFLAADLEGMSLYYGANGEGQIIVSVQSRNEYAVFDRKSYLYLASFSIDKITTPKGIDEVSHTDGIDIISSYMGPELPYGIFIAQDDENTSSTGKKLNQNFKAIANEKINQALKNLFPINNSFNPRQMSLRKNF